MHASSEPVHYYTDASWKLGAGDWWIAGHLWHAAVHVCYALQYSRNWQSASSKHPSLWSDGSPGKFLAKTKISTTTRSSKHWRSQLQQSINPAISSLNSQANTGVLCINQNQAISALNSQANTESFASINQLIYLYYCFFIFLFLFFCWVLEAICSNGRKSVENVDLLVDWFFCKNHEGRKYQLGFSPVFYFLGFLLLVSFIWRSDLRRCFTYCQEAINKNWWALEVMIIDDSYKQMSAGSPTYQLFLGP